MTPGSHHSAHCNDACGLPGIAIVGGRGAIGPNRTSNESAVRTNGPTDSGLFTRAPASQVTLWGRGGIRRICTRSIAYCSPRGCRALRGLQDASGRTIDWLRQVLALGSGVSVYLVFRVLGARIGFRQLLEVAAFGLRSRVLFLHSEISRGDWRCERRPSSCRRSQCPCPWWRIASHPCNRVCSGTSLLWHLSPLFTVSIPAAIAWLGSVGSRASKVSLCGWLRALASHGLYSATLHV